MASATRIPEEHRKLSCDIVPGRRATYASLPAGPSRRSLRLTIGALAGSSAQILTRQDASSGWIDRHIYRLERHIGKIILQRQSAFVREGKQATYQFEETWLLPDI